eukprot:scaffold14914_cov82-Isochrysis_galbana.AAC.1
MTWGRRAGLGGRRQGHGYSGMVPDPSFTHHGATTPASSSPPPPPPPAQLTMTPALVSNPSISVRIWLSVCSRSSLPPVPPVPGRVLPTASISSIKRMHGAFFWAWTRHAGGMMLGGGNGVYEEDSAGGMMLGGGQWRL